MINMRAQPGGKEAQQLAHQVANWFVAAALHGVGKG